MHLTLHTDYSLRLLMLLAAEPGELCTIASVAQRFRISRHHLTKVTQTLVHAGFLHSQRGRGGGLQLARPAMQIRVGDVVRATENNFRLVECFDKLSNQCLIAGACGLQAPLIEATRAFLAVLDRHTLADMVAQPSHAARMRRLSASPG
jgi:Rrf2 family nitric oxide-sensitive transcriptional repressor